MNWWIVSLSIIFLIIIYRLSNIIRIQREELTKIKKKNSDLIIGIETQKAIISKYQKNYNDLMKNLNGETSLSIDKKEPVEYDVNDILSEISSKGIDKISKDKINFLKKYGKNDTNI